MNVKKIVLVVMCLHSAVILPSMLRTRSSSPLLFNIMDVLSEDKYVSISLFNSRSFDPSHIAESLTINGKSSFTLDEGSKTQAANVNGDINPNWLALSNGGSESYKSTVTFTPKVKTCGLLLHFNSKYKEKYFFDVKTALLRVGTQVSILEKGGGDGITASLKNFQDVMNNSNFNYGKIGNGHKKIGIDNIQFVAGMIHDFKLSSDNENILAGYLIVELPTGRGTKAESMFEPRVGHNHLGLGVGVDEYYMTGSSQVVVGANWRYLFGAKEKRSFDLKGKPWSRYIRMIPLPSSTGTGTRRNAEAFNAINVLTLDATVKMGNELNGYLRWLKKLKNNVECEIGYNILYRQKEQISDLASFSSSFGVDYLAAPNGATLNKADMKSSRSTHVWDAKKENPGKAITLADVDPISAAAGAIVMSSLMARCEYLGDRFRGGFGLAFEGAHSKSAYASWNGWANLGYVF